MADHTLRPATKADLHAASNIFGEAFQATPQWRWMIEDDEARSAVLPAFFAASLRYALKRGRLMVAQTTATGSLAGVCAWLPPGRWKVPAWLGVTAVPQVIPYVRSGALGDFIVRGRALDGAAKEAHPKEPHWYLAGVGVAPHAQGSGVGTRLIREGLQHLDGKPAYLECEEALVGYYETFGFRPLHRIDPGDGVPVQIGMWFDA